MQIHGVRARLMEDTDVAISPGIGFGPEGEGWVRLALMEYRQRLLQATRNIKRVFTKWRSESQLSAK